MDLVTGLPRTRSGFDAIWVIVDRLTKSAHFLPIRVNCSIEELARLYIKEIVFGSFPKSLRYEAVSQYRISPVNKWTIGEDYSDAGRYAESMCVGSTWELGTVTCHWWSLHTTTVFMRALGWLHMKHCRTEVPVSTLLKSYANQRRKPLEFEVGEHVFRWVTTTTGIGRAIKTKKLNPRYIGPFEILKRFGPVAYQVALPPHLSNLHDVFYVSQHRKYTLDASHVLEPESVELKENLTFQLMPVRIDDTSVKKLRGKDVSLVKVAWERAGLEEHTWELESEMRKDYPELFSGTVVNPACRGSGGGVNMVVNPTYVEI
ncbi:uncharacterized protein LOC130974938 [Arachis stenosperma]|uniref:uncharacterized protein LOC130974938 n=1 Tax=Arachis stenosperma TaxID=217475 RepID=UPI0025AC1872|nr:uncharacterized protein LOC130974938 [Arachis stenosperma]